MVELTANGETFELETRTDIKYVKQIADIFDIASVATSYTNGFDIPKTPHNTRIMQGLGIVGDSSQIPYEKVPAVLKNHGFSLLEKGWLQVKETSDSYKVSIIDGMIDFFKAIENKTMGVDLDLANFNHDKTLSTVADSFTNDYYKYIIADYNGRNAEISGINIDYQVPCFNVGKLLELVMSTFGFTYDDSNLTELNELYITYPKSPADDVSVDLIAEFYKDFFIALPNSIGGGVYAATSQEFWDSSTVTEGTVLENWRYVIPTDGAYRFDISVEAYAQYRRFGDHTPLESPMTVNVTKNGITYTSFQTDPLAPVEATDSNYFSAGDILEVEMRVSPFMLGQYRLRAIHHNSTYFNVYKTNQGVVSLSDAFKDFQIKDFIKEIIWRTSVTPVINRNNHITFYTVAERLDFARSQNWSDKYIRRTNESYVNGNYAQKNIFQHKYNTEGETTYNGFLFLNNRNVEAEKIIVNSKIYAPENAVFEIKNFGSTITLTTKKFPIWSRETKEGDDGEIEIEYKGLSNRFFFIKAKQSPVSTWVLYSTIVEGSQNVTQIHYADSEGTTFDQIVPEKYNEYSAVLNDFRAHEIELMLGLEDILSLDLTRPKYIEQEGQYYVLNRVTFEEGKPATGEFIRINKRTI